MREGARAGFFPDASGIRSPAIKTSLDDSFFPALPLQRIPACFTSLGLMAIGLRPLRRLEPHRLAIVECS